MQFLGNIDAKVDGKGRVFVPAQFRRILEGEGGAALVLRVSSNPRFAKLYPMKEWERVNEELKSKLNLWDRKDQAIYRQFAAKAEQLDIDSNGRILLQRKNLEALGVEADVVFAGVGDYIELWSRSEFDAAMMSEDDLDSALESLMK